jgi:hypothetical protein
MPKQSDKDDDGNRNTEQPKKYRSAHSQIPSFDVMPENFKRRAEVPKVQRRLACRFACPFGAFARRSAARDGRCALGGAFRG